MQTWEIGQLRYAATQINVLQWWLQIPLLRHKVQSNSAVVRLRSLHPILAYRLTKHWQRINTSPRMVRCIFSQQKAVKLSGNALFTLQSQPYNRESSWIISVRLVGSLAPHLTCTQVGAHGEENATECNGQIGKLLPHLWLSIPDRQSKQRIAKATDTWFIGSQIRRSKWNRPDGKINLIPPLYFVLCAVGTPNTNLTWMVIKLQEY